MRIRAQAMTTDRARTFEAQDMREVVGFGTTADAFRITDTHPEGRGAVSCIQMALKDAGLRTDQIDYINAHGTSTDVNDRVETMAIRQALGADAYKTPVSSVKSMMGHLIAAAGAVPVGVGDGDNLNLMIGLEDSLNFSGATLTGEDALSDIFASLGRAVNTADADSDAYGIEKADLSDLRDSISGVDLDEEATSLISWQAAYQASSRVVTATNQLLAELMEMVR